MHKAAQDRSWNNGRVGQNPRNDDRERQDKEHGTRRHFQRQEDDFCHLVLIRNRITEREESPLLKRCYALSVLLRSPEMRQRPDFQSW